MFALERVKEIKGKIDFFVLVKNEVNQYEEVKKQLQKEGNYESELNTIQTRLQSMAELQSLPETKCRQLHPKSEKDYEIKTKNLRLYLFHLENKGRVIVFLGKKTNQKKDIKRFRSIKKEYLEQL
ncbi:hypothetical protein QYS49_34310 [Marivirga salinae]|uniref:Uncharacterized protein n=1 Tax=Marivirga salinarum TaxID=3059078 RepID=A0AA51RBV1_9BACT|nr:hypothetical protein [Marivirga sp. BDSF4-3]WMN12691.1 hypothetical protein QYS49_34310 [Marivirga sp. BDSF4-3]